jgi:hypothetical protein
VLINKELLFAYKFGTLPPKIVINTSPGKILAPKIVLLIFIISSITVP